MSKIAFIGDRDSVWGFKAFGITALPATGTEEARDAFTAAVKQGHAIIFVTEDVYEACSEQIAEYRDQALPTVTVLPSVKGSRGIATAEIHKAVSAAVGADILSVSGDN
jgi:V/A-type H+-transporting ATPase subunit F